MSVFHNKHFGLHKEPFSDQFNNIFRIFFAMERFDANKEPLFFFLELCFSRSDCWNIILLCV